MTQHKHPLITFISAFLIVALPLTASAHAFPKRASPRVGSTIKATPPDVRIWFDAGLEGIFCSLTVKNKSGQIVSTGHAQVIKGSHNRLLETQVKHLTPGKYHVYWSVIAVDGHHTEGHYAFRIRK